MNLGTGVLIVNEISLQGVFENTVPLAYNCTTQTVVETLTYLKAASTLFAEAERADIVSVIASDPEAGDLMPGTGGGIANGGSDGPE